MIKQFLQRILKANYEVVDGTGARSRKQNAINIRHEDSLLKGRDRDKLVSEARLLRRNSSEVAWMIRMHLAYVTQHTFQANTRITLPDGSNLDDKLHKLVNNWSKAENFEATGLHDLQTTISLLEAGRVTDGDSFLIKLSGGQVQAVEADQIRNPTDLGSFKDSDIDLSLFQNGVHKSKSGRPLRYLVCDRNENQFVLRAIVPAKYVIHHVLRDRFGQFRGVSPLASAINQFFDLHECNKYALSKMKLSQLHGLLIRQDGAEEDETDQDFDLNSGAKTLLLGKDDSAEFLESRTPSTEFQSFREKLTQAAIKALDLPYSFYSEDFTNYSGARQALQMYGMLAANKRAAIQNLLMTLTRWRLTIFIQDGELTLPDGLTVDDLNIEWIGVGMPWIDPIKEMKAHAEAVKLKVKSRQQICRETGKNWFEIVDQLAEEEAYISVKLSPEPPLKEQKDDEEIIEVNTPKMSNRKGQDE